MTPAKIAHLADRGVVRITGSDAVAFLQGLVTNDVEQTGSGRAAHAALLTPQGKILFDFFALRQGDGFLLDTLRGHAKALTTRLAMYKLRADVVIEDASDAFAVFAVWEPGGEPDATGTFAGAFRDPRHTELGFRVLADLSTAADAAPSPNATPEDYDILRVRLGVPEGGKDYVLGDAFPHEADFDLFNGVSFRKGCYVGQEVVSRMQNKTLVRKRAVKVRGEAPLATGADVALGDVAIGRIGTVAGPDALAMIRLDRAAEAQDKSLALTANGVPLVVDDAALARYRAAADAREKAAQSPSPGRT